MIVSRTIPAGSIRVDSFVVEMIINLSKYNELIKYIEFTGVFEIDVDVTWDASDDAALDLLITNHDPVPLSPIFGKEKEEVFQLGAPISTNSSTFQLAFSVIFFASNDWRMDLDFLYQYNIASNNQGGEVEIRLNGAPILTNRHRGHNSSIESRGGKLPLTGLNLGANTIDLYYRKVNGNALITISIVNLITRLGRQL